MAETTSIAPQPGDALIEREKPLPARRIDDARGAFKGIDTDVPRERGDRCRFEAVLAKVPDVPPVPGDKLD